MSKKVVVVDAVAAAEAIIARPDVFEMHGVSHGVHLELATAEWIGSDAFVSPVLESVTERHGDTLLAVGRGAGGDLDLDAAIAHVTTELLKHQLVVTELVRGDGVAECLVRRARSDDDFVEVRVATLGTVDAGKCWDPETLVRMHDGSVKRVDEVNTSDLLMGDDSTPREVLEVFRGTSLMFQIIPMNGEPLVVTANHTLCLKASNSNYVRFDANRNRHTACTFVVEDGLPRFRTKMFVHQTPTRPGFTYADAEHAAHTYVATLPNVIRKGDVFEMTVRDYVQLPKDIRSELRLYRTAINYPSREVPMDPWLLGHWLGEGTSATTVITTTDPKIVQAWKTRLPPGAMIRKSTAPTARYCYIISGAERRGQRIHNPVLNSLRDINVLSNKHIPDLYKHNSVEVRRAVLAGFIDADAHRDHNGYYFKLTANNERLVDDLIEVARSLGLAAYKKAGMATCTNGANGPVQCPIFAFSFHGDGMEHFPVVLERKRVTPRESRKSVLVTGIADIVPLGDGPYVGFRVTDNQRHVLADFTVVHNSTICGVLTHNMLDNGRGLARAPILKHQHEQDNGQTSSVGRNILGFDSAGTIVNRPGHSGKLDWTTVCTNASKVVTFIDCAGHEKYFGTTAFGMTGHCPHYAMVLIGAHAGIQTMTKEFMKLACGLKVPMFMVLAKIDMAPPEMRARAVRHIERICVSPAIQRPATHVCTVKDALAAHKGMCREAVTPVFQISNVDGTGLDLLRTFLGLLAPTDATRDDDAPVMFSIDEDFTVRGVGLVVSGFVNAGTMRPKDELLLGPFADNTFARVVVFSLMRHRLPVGEVRSRQLATIALRRAPGASREIKRDDIRRGMVLASADRKPQGAWQFWAMVTVLEIKSTVLAGYQGMLHCGGVRQTVKIMQIDTDDHVMRTGSKARCLLTFVKNPEILTPDTRFAMREGTAKLVGKILEPIFDSAPYNRQWRRNRKDIGGVDGHPGEHAILGRRERRRLKKEKTADARDVGSAIAVPMAST